MASEKRAEWGIAVRLSDGRSLFYSPDSGRQGQEEWSPRPSQARRYPTRQEAERVANAFSTNEQAREYLAVQLG